MFLYKNWTFRECPRPKNFYFSFSLPPPSVSVCLTVSPSISVLPLCLFSLSCLLIISSCLLWLINTVHGGAWVFKVAPWTFATRVVCDLAAVGFTGILLARQHFGPYPRPKESESTFEQDPQGIYVQKVWEALAWKSLLVLPSQGGTVAPERKGMGSENTAPRLLVWLAGVRTRARARLWVGDTWSCR